MGSALIHIEMKMRISGWYSSWLLACTVGICVLIMTDEQLIPRRADAIQLGLIKTCLERLSGLGVLRLAGNSIDHFQLSLTGAISRAFRDALRTPSDLFNAHFPC